MALRLLYGYCCLGWACPDLGAIGGTVYFDDRRGQCFCGVMAVTVWSFVALVFAFLAAQEDPDQVSAFGFARLQSDPASLRPDKNHACRAGPRTR